MAQLNLDFSVFINYLIKQRFHGLHFFYIIIDVYIVDTYLPLFFFNTKSQIPWDQNYSDSLN